MGKGTDLATTFPKALKEETRQAPHRLLTAFAQLSGSQVPGRRARAKLMDHELELVSEASGLDHVSAALLGTNSMGTGPSPECDTAYGLS